MSAPVDTDFAFRLLVIGARRYSRFPEERRQAATMLALNAYRLLLAEVGAEQARWILAHAEVSRDAA